MLQAPYNLAACLCAFALATAAPLSAAEPWSVSGKLVFPDRFSPFTPPAFSPDGKVVAIAGKEGNGQAFRQEEGVLLLFGVATKKLKARWSLGRNRMPGKLQWHPKGKALVLSVAAISKVTVEVWDVARQRAIRRIPLPRNPGIRTSRGWSLSPDGKVLAVADWGRGVLIYDLKTMRVRRILKAAKVITVAYSPDGKLIATGSMAAGGLGAGDDVPAKSTHLWDARTGKLLRSLPWQLPERLIFSDDSKYLVGTWLPLAKTVKTLDLAAAKEVDLVQGEAPEQVLFSPDDRYVFVLEPPAPQNLGIPAKLYAVEVWDRRSKKKVASIDTRFTSGIALSPDGYTLAVPSLDNPLGVGPGANPGTIQLYKSDLVRD